MLLQFRQGIVEAQTPTFITVTYPTADLVVTNTNVVVAFASGDKDYLYTEQESVQNAWGPLYLGVDQWLYWDLSTRTGERTFGITLYNPVVAANAPQSPKVDQHWFNTLTNTMNVWSGTAWVKKIRTFACMLSQGKIPVSMSNKSPSFIGTQVGNITTVYAGHILFDATTNTALKNASGEFMTTEDKLTTNAVSLSSVKVASIIVEAEAQQNMVAHTIVKFSEFGKIVHADQYLTTHLTPYGIIEQNVTVGQVTTVSIGGIISSPTFDFSGLGVNAPLYCSTSGQLVATPTAPDQHPIAVVVDPTTIQLLQATVPTSVQSSTSVDNATDTTLGIVRLSVPSEDVNDPVAVGDNDPRWHSYISRSGDTMTGPLTLANDPVHPLDAATKGYVDQPKTLDSLSDVIISTPLNDQIIKYVSGSGWVNATVPAVPTTMADLTDVKFLNPSVDQILKFDGTNWVNSTITLPPATAGNLSGLGDVTLTTPVVNQTLSFDGTKWVNITPATPPTPITTLSALTDVTVSALSTDQYLKYDGAKWVNAALPTPPVVISALSGLSDVTLTTPVVNQTLSFDGTKWVNITPATPPTPITTLSGLSDVAVTSPTNQQILQYNGTKWVNATVSAGSGGGSASALSGLTDVSLTVPTNGQAVVFNGSTWMNSYPNTIQTSNAKLQMVDVGPSGNATLTIGGTNSAVFDSTAATFSTPPGVEWTAIYGDIPVDITMNYGASVRIDSAGNIITVGATAVDGVGFVVKYDTHGNKLWAVSFTDTNSANIQYQGAECIEVDSADNIYVIFSDRPSDSVVIKLSPSGTVIWQRLVGDLTNGGNATNYIQASTIRANGNLIVAGVGDTGQTGIFVEIDGSGSLVHKAAIQAGGLATEVTGVAVDPASGDVFVTYNAFALTNGSSGVARLTSAGTVVWAMEKQPTSNINHATLMDIVVHPSGYVFVAGFRNDLTVYGNIIKLDAATGTLQWDKLYKPTTVDVNYAYSFTALAVDPTGTNEIYVSGWNLLPTTVTGTDIVVMRFDPTDGTVINSMVFDYNHENQSVWYDYGHKSIDVRNGIMAHTVYTSANYQSGGNMLVFVVKPFTTAVSIGKLSGAPAAATVSTEATLTWGTATSIVSSSPIDDVGVPVTALVVNSNPSYKNATTNLGDKYNIVVSGYVSMNDMRLGDMDGTAGNVVYKTATGARWGELAPISWNIDTTRTTGTSAKQYVNSMAIGYGAEVTGINQIQLGDLNTTTYVYGTVQNRSDIRDKADIRDTIFGLDFINMLRPVDFKWDLREAYTTVDANGTVTTHPRDGSKKRNRYHSGLIAQELGGVAASLGVDFGGLQDHSTNGGEEVLTIGYDELIAPLIKAVQELTAQVNELKAKLAAK